MSPMTPRLEVPREPERDEASALRTGTAPQPDASSFSRTDDDDDDDDDDDAAGMIGMKAGTADAGPSNDTRFGTRSAGAGAEPAS